MIYCIKMLPFICLPKGARFMPSKYIILADSLRTLLEQHKTEKNFHLPTEQQLSIQYQVSRQTVRHALSILAEEGLIIRRQGSGSYPSPDFLSAAARIIAVILPDTASYLHSSALRDIQAFFNAHHYTVRIYMTDYLLEREQEILQNLLAEPPAAILVKPFCTALPNPNLPLFQKLSDQRVPVVFWDEPMPQTRMPGIFPDYHAGGYALASYLIRQNHQHIAGIFQKEELESHEKFAGLVQALWEHHLSFDSRNFYWYDSHPYPYLKKTLDPTSFPEEFLDRISQSCTCVLCHNDEAAYALIRALLRKGISVPRNLAVVSFDDSYFTELSPVSITSMSCGKEKPWSRASRFLLQKLQGKQPETAPFTWELQKRDSG